MRIIFIRHAEPDYEHNTITEKGWREAKLLAPRVKGWNVTKFYCSPYGRAQDTAKPSLEACGREAEIIHWMREFDVHAYNTVNRRTATAWDIYPGAWMEDPRHFDKDRWHKSPLYRNSGIREEYDTVIKSFDEMLAQYGYHRHHNYYHVDDDAHRDDTLVCFCHLGVTCVFLSHLLGISPIVLLHSLFIPPSSVTIVQTEERIPGSACFRCQSIGDTTHLYIGEEPVSIMASFVEPFQERDYDYHFDEIPSW